jgi:cardiolipin synthase (CMP-forming)
MVQTDQRSPPSAFTREARQSGRSGQRNEPRWFRSLPNAISVLRLLLVPVGVWLAEDLRASRLAGDAHSAVPLALLLLGLGLSDLVDGWLARRYELTTETGATLDAVADKLAQFVFVSYFTFRPIPEMTALPIWFFALVFARDLALAIGLLTVRIREQHVSTQHQLHGKISSLMLSCVILSIVLELPEAVTAVGCGISAMMILASTAAYLTLRTRS